MAIGERIRIISEEEYRIMSPPRKPRGEKPITTIRLLRRHLSVAQATIQALQLDRADKEKVIAGYDVQLSEAQDIERTLRGRVADQAIQLGAEQHRRRIQSERLAFLEGYYAKSQEATALPVDKVSRSIGVLARDTPQIDPDRRARNQAHYQAMSQGTAVEPGPAGFDERFGTEIPSEPAHNQAHQMQRSVEHVEINDRIRAARRRVQDWRP